MGAKHVIALALFILYASHSVLAQSQTQDAVEEFAKPLAHIISDKRPQLTDLTDLVNQIPKVANALPKFSELSPPLLRHILNGGDLPGVPRKTLDNVITRSQIGVKQRIFVLMLMSQEADRQNRIARGEDPKNLPPAARRDIKLPPLSDLPRRFVNSVTKGEVLPGLTREETTSIRDYYLRKIRDKREEVEAAKPHDAPKKRLPPGIIEGLSPEDLASRLPPSFDINRLPRDLLDAASSGRPFDIRQLPKDMLEDFRRYNPDLNDAIDEALNRQPLSEDNREEEATSEEEQPVHEFTTVPSELWTNPLAMQGSDTQERALLDDPKMVRTLTYALIGIGSFAAISLTLVIGMCLRNRDRRKAEHYERSYLANGLSTDVVRCMQAFF